MSQNPIITIGIKDTQVQFPVGLGQPSDKLYTPTAIYVEIYDGESVQKVNIGSLVASYVKEHPAK